MGNKITMQDVAEMSGVSVSTVSLALRGLAQVEVTTRARIVRAARELGYPLERLAGKNATGNIGFVLHDRFSSVGDILYTYMLGGAQTQAQRLNYHVISEVLSDEQVQKHELPSLIRARKVDGVIFAGWLDNEYIQALLMRPIPVVLLNSNLVDPPVNSVECDNLGAARQAAAHLLELGHRRIGVIAGPLDRPGTVPRLDGYKLALLNAGVDYDPQLVLSGLETNDLPHGYKAAETLYTRVGGDVTAILCLADTLALGVLRFCRDRGLPVPERISVMGFDDHVTGEHAEPPLTSMHLRKWMMGRHAAARVIELLNLAEEAMPVKIVAPAELSLRQSTGPAPSISTSDRRFRGSAAQGASRRPETVENGRVLSS